MNAEKYVVSFNVAGWNWKLTKEPFGERLKRACRCIKSEASNAWLVGLSEVIPGTDGKYIDVIKQEFPNYVVVLPKAYTSSNYRAAINILLINRGTMSTKPERLTICQIRCCITMWVLLRTMAISGY